MGDKLTPEEQALQDMILDILIVLIAIFMMGAIVDEVKIGLLLSSGIPSLALAWGIGTGLAVLATAVWALYTMNKISQKKGSNSKVIDKRDTLMMLATVGVSGIEELLILILEDQRQKGG